MPRHVKAPLFAAIACAAAIAPLAAAAYSTGPIKRLDLRIFFQIVHEPTAPIFHVASFLVLFGDLAGLLVLLAAICALGLWLGRRREVVAALIVVAGANLTTQLLKTTMEHVRAKAWEHNVEMPWANSFPSGHTTAAASIAVALLLVVPAIYRPTAAAVGLLITSAVAISVVVMGWHYPSDVLGGLLVVAAWGFAAVAALRLRTGRDRAVSGAPSGPRGTWAVSTD